jgi:hypothetical protein
MVTSPAPLNARTVRADLAVAREKNTRINNNKIRESSALQEPSQKAQRAGGHNAGAFIAPAPVGVVETMARRLSPPATASLIGVIDGGNDRRAVSSPT